MQNPYETVAFLKDRKEEREKTDLVLPDLAKINIQAQLLVPQPADESLYREMMHITPARIGVWRTGTRPLTRTMLRFRADHALAQDSVLGMVPEEFASAHGLISIQTQAENKEQYLTRPDLGRKLSPEAKETLTKEGTAASQVQVVVSDGLSSKAIEANIPDLLPALMQGLDHYGFIIGKPIFVKYGRVACMDEIGEILHPESLVILIGERPGLGTAESLSAYMAYKPHRSMVEAERSVISNIHRGGIPPLEAGAHLASLMKQILSSKASGVRY